MWYLDFRSMGALRARGVLPYIGYTGMCCPKGYGFSAVLVINRVSILERVRLGSIRNKNNWNNASKRLFGSYSHSGIPGFPFHQQKPFTNYVYGNLTLV